MCCERWLLPVKGKNRRVLFQQAASTICTTNWLLWVCMKLGRGCSQKNLVCSSLSSLVKGKKNRDSSWCKGREKHVKALLGSECLPRERCIEGVPCVDGDGEICGELWVFHWHTSKQPAPSPAEQKARKHWAF